MQARFYRFGPGESPTFVEIGGVFYQRQPAEDQEEIRLTFERQAIAESLGAFGEEAANLAYRLQEVEERLAAVAQDRLERRLVTLLPRHDRVIRSVFEPDVAPIGDEELARHSRCRLPEDES